MISRDPFSSHAIIKLLKYTRTFITAKRNLLPSSKRNESKQVKRKTKKKKNVNHVNINVTKINHLVNNINKSNTV